MKKILSFFLLLTAFSFQSIAQGPVDDDPSDPGGDIYTYQNGYSEGAIEAINLKVSLGPTYDGVIDFIEWHSYDPTMYNNLGAVVDFNSPGLKVPVVIWANLPTYLLFEDPTVFDTLLRLDQNRDGSQYTEGYYAGFSDNLYYHPW